MISDSRIQEIKSHPWFNSVKGKLEHIQRFLHDGSASAMVGAGFSRNAEQDSNVQVKDWEGLAFDFYKRLYGGNPNKQDLSLKSALRLASQVECQYGRNELDRIIEQAVPNDKLKPGPLHIALVNLPWHDIFTTNYDQLLEKTPTKLSYNLVTNKETLLYKTHPRIIKLHGSFPDIKPYIVSEEDYRKYPDTHPEFVNTVRQSLIESALCLFGFSGDDPNFLNWIGWIRDKMGEHLAPIYLFDVSENGHHESELSLLRQRRIEVISINNSPFNNRAEFFEFIFQFLSENPAEDSTEWSARVPHELISSIKSVKIDNGNYTSDIDLDKLNRLISTYKEIREAYPGWLFIPVNHLEDAFEDTFSNELQSIKQVISNIPIQEKIELLFELEWRIRMSFIPVSLLPWFAIEIHKVIDGLNKEEILNDHRLVVLCMSLLSYHRQRYEIEEFEKLAMLMSDVQNTSDTATIRRYLYERCLSAVSLVDYSKAQQILSIWNPAPEDYLGILWKSAIMIEIGLFEDAYSLLIKTHTRLQNAYKTYHNLNLAYSTLGAYESVIRTLEPYSDRRSAINKDLAEYYIYRYFRYEKGKLYDGRDKNGNNRSRFRTHEFNLNHVVNHYSMNNSNRDSESQFAGRLQMVWESFGYPYLLNAITINPSMMALSSDSLMSTGNAPLALNVLIRSAQRDTIKKVLTKQVVSVIEPKVIETIFDALIHKAETTLDWNHPGTGMRLSIAVTQILRRFCVRLDADRIKKIVPVLLLIREKRSMDYTNEALRTIFNCLSEEDLCEIFPNLACAPIEMSEHDRCIIFPTIECEVSIPDSAIEIITKAFANENKDIRNNAYLRAVRIINHCNPAQKQKIINAIIAWRKRDMEISINSTYSFNVVPFDKSEETISPLDRIRDCLINLKGNDLPNNNGDIVIYAGKAEDNLCILEALVKNIPSERQDEVANILNQRLGKILERTQKAKSTWEQAFGHPDKDELRVIAYILARLNYENINPSNAKDACDKLVELAKSGYPKLYAIFEINKSVHLLTNEEFELILRNCILSSEEDIRENAFNFMTTFGFDANKNIWSLVWNKIQFSSSPEVSSYLSLVMDTCEAYPLNVSKVNNLPDILNSIKECTNEESWLDGDRFDIQYQVMRMLGYVSKCDCSAELKKAINNWLPNSNIPANLPNDVKLGFYEGVRIWRKHNSATTQCAEQQDF